MKNLVDHYEKQLMNYQKNCLNQQKEIANLRKQLVEERLKSKQLQNQLNNITHLEK